DISEFGERRTSVAARADYDQRQGDSGRAWAAVGKPIIAMIRGYCIGGGPPTPPPAHIRPPSPPPHVRVPAPPARAGYPLRGGEALVDVVGNAWAAEILFSARRLSAAEALHIGLINRVVPSDELEGTVAELAASIAANAPLTVAACKAALRELRRPADK